MTAQPGHTPTLELSQFSPIFLRANKAPRNVHLDRNTPHRILLINASSGGAVVRLARQVLERLEAEVDILHVAMPMPDLEQRCLLAHGIILIAEPNPQHIQALIKRVEQGLQGAGLADRVYGVLTPGELAGAAGTRRRLTGWLDEMGLIDSEPFARLDRYVGYFDPHMGSRPSFDDDMDLQEEVRNVARAVHKGVTELRAGRLSTRR